MIQADYALIDGTLTRNVFIVVNDEGFITQITQQARPATMNLPDRLLLPGFVNVHSHSFQRGLRGRGESFQSGRGSFWSWREAMYALVESFDCDQVRRLARQAFGEMLDAGITSVGEFHYLHHDDAEARDFAFDAAVLQAARDVGIRIVLILTYYETGGFGQPLSGGQRRFSTPSVERFFEQVDQLATTLDPQLQSIGIAAHSIRAVPLLHLQALYEGAVRRKMVFHMHLEEQRKEIADCEQALGKRPMDAVLHALPEAKLTAVHATHTAATTLEKLFARGGRVCMCPLTEANLGDGIADVPAMNRQDGSICLGTDSNARISMLEEMRWLEYVQRLRHEQRGIVLDHNGEVGLRLLQIATANGAAALGLPAGAIEEGRAADFVSVNLSHPSLAACGDESILNAVCLGMADDGIDATCVGGIWRKRANVAERVSIGE
ncbi:MAG: formimidoylglutamate deiminase [Phycisphaerae bacterium]